MDKPMPVQPQSTGGYQMNPMSPGAAQMYDPNQASPGNMQPQQTGYPPSEPPNYHQQQQPQQQQQNFPMGQQQPMQGPPMQSPPQPYSYPDGSYGMPLTTLGSSSAPVLCPNCGHRGMTNVEYESGGFTHLVALAVCCFICLGCFAYMSNSLKDAHHRCSKCGVPLATYHRSGRTELHFRPQ